MNPLLPALGLTACYGLAIWGIVMVRDRSAVRMRVGGGPDVERPLARVPLSRLVDRLADRLAPRAASLLGPRRLIRVRRVLDAAGKPSSTTVEGYVGRKAAYTVIFGIPGLILASEGELIPAACLFVLGWIWPDIWLSGEARRRQAQIDRDLPDFLDILAVVVAAGVGFRPALRRVAHALGGPLGEEVSTGLHQMELGASRRDALESLRRRNRSEALSQFVTALLQAEELGVPLAEALTHLADDMRRAAHQSARRRAARAAPRVSLIVSLLIVPAALILILAALLVGSDFSLGGLLGD
jgi:tight adherence protein C